MQSIFHIYRVFQDDNPQEAASVTYNTLKDKNIPRTHCSAGMCMYNIFLTTLWQVYEIVLQAF